MKLSNQSRAHLATARFLASKSEAKKTHGAVVVKGGRVVGVGWNKNRNDPQAMSEEHIKTDASYHAEEVALREAGDNARGAILYVARVNKQGEDRDSKPCFLCSTLMVSAGIKKVIYTTEGVVEDVYY